MAQFDCLLGGGDCPIDGSLYLLQRCLAAFVHKWRNVEGFTGMVKDVLGNGAGRLSKNITEDIVKLQVGDSQAVLSAVLLPDKHVGELGTVTRTKSRSWRISGEGIKLGFIMFHMKRSQIHLAFLRSVLFPFWGLVYLGWVRVTKQDFSRTLKTGNQYLPVDSMQTSKHEYLASQSDSSLRPLEKEEKRACLYFVRPFISVIPMQA